MRTFMVKVGGSLLTLPDLPDRLKTMLDSVAADRVMLLVGGGRSADLVRSWDEIHRLDTDASHWLAIDSMGLTARLLAKLLPDTRLVSGHAEAHDAGISVRTMILDPRPVIEEATERATTTLPVGWDCTSDSIAGWLANQWKVESLVLAKSIDIPVSEALSPQQGSGVDPVFPSMISGSMTVYWCNVRTAPHEITLWKPATVGS
ncbi:MAG: hypothetical protein O2945_16830 [Planctomycetota bacterium]|nr:hypothetical protein [Planctomycetota bacterium]MDA0920739.1 hypothetical protein [Planctomycetota bacterium]